MISRENGEGGVSNPWGRQGAWCASLYVTGAAGRRRQAWETQRRQAWGGLEAPGERRVRNQTGTHGRAPQVDAPSGCGTRPAQQYWAKNEWR